MLVIGGFRTWASDLQDFEAAAADYLGDAVRKGEHKHVLGIGLLSFLTLVGRDPTQQSAQAALKMAYVANPGYEGTITIITETPPHLRRPAV